MNERIAAPAAPFTVDPKNPWECAYLARRLGVSEDELRRVAGRLDTPTIEILSQSLAPH